MQITISACMINKMITTSVVGYDTSFNEVTIEFYCIKRLLTMTKHNISTSLNVILYSLLQ